MHIILFFLLFLLAIVIFGLSVIGFILRAIFGIGGGSKAKQTYNRQNNKQQDGPKYNQKTKSYEDDDFYSDATGHNRKKIFSKDEGEYVDYEDIKE